MRSDIIYRYECRPIVIPVLFFSCSVVFITVFGLGFVEYAVSLGYRKACTFYMPARSLATSWCIVMENEGSSFSW